MKKNPSVLDIANELMSKGYEVDIYIRTDGSALIKRINGEKFSGAKGNARARQILGVQLSEARAKQLKYATRQRKRPKDITLDDEILKEYRRVKKKWNKAFKSKKGKAHPAGYFGLGKIEYTFKKYGKEETLLRIKEAERYATGIAYSKAVATVAGFIQDYAIKANSQELMDVARDMMENAYAIRGEWLQPALDELYKLNQGKDPKEVARNVRAILRL